MNYEPNEGLQVPFYVPQSSQDASKHLIGSNTAENLLKALSEADMPVLAISESGERETTFAKAMYETQLAKDIIEDEYTKQARRDAQHTATIQRLGQLTKQAKSYWHNVHCEKFVDRVEQQIRVYRTELQKAEAKESIAKSKAKTRKAIAKSNDAKNAAKASRRELERKIADIAAGIHTVTSNFEAANSRIVKSATRIIQDEQDRMTKEPAFWLEKANDTKDPDLKAAYFAQANALKGQTEGE